MPASPLSDQEFAACMAALGPLGRRPRLAVGVSGGGDSLALTWLLQRWCRRRGGGLLALTVEHGLRPESAGEARSLGRQLRALGIAHRILPWRGDKPAGTFEAAARAARYALLQRACRRAGIVLLALAHQGDDQAETLDLRAAAGSGLRGLAGMSAVAALDEILLLRPLLAVPHARLLATCRAAGLDWVEDPGNADAASGRRAALRTRPGRAAARPGRLALARKLGARRVTLEAAAARLLARAVEWHPAGFARLSAVPLGADSEGAALALGELLRCLGGGDFPPGAAALRTALARLAEPRPRGFTLGGCRLLPGAAGWLVAREETAGPAELAPGGRGLWDRRWAWRLPAVAPRGLFLGPLGRAGWQGLAGALAPAPLPGPALWSLPALSDGQALLAVPALRWERFPGAAAGLALHFAPNPAGTFGFTVACRQGHII